MLSVVPSRSMSYSCSLSFITNIISMCATMWLLYYIVPHSYITTFIPPLKSARKKMAETYNFNFETIVGNQPPLGITWGDHLWEPLGLNVLGKFLHLFTTIYTALELGL